MQQLSRLSAASPALFFASKCFVRGLETLASSLVLSNAISKAFYFANLRLERKKAHHETITMKILNDIKFVNRRRTASPWSPSSSPRTRPHPTCLLPSGRIR